jgi:hypothetical protein
MTVAPGQEITFEYGGGGAHPMTSDSNPMSPMFFPTITVTSSDPIATFTLTEVGTYYFHCGTNPGNSSLWGGITVEESSVGIDEQLSVPKQFEITNVYPNPFNPTTTMTFKVDDLNAFTLEIFNINGQLIKTFANENLTIGLNSVKWNGLNNTGKLIQSGIYFIQATSGNHVKSKTITLLK